MRGADLSVVGVYAHSKYRRGEENERRLVSLIKKEKRIEGSEWEQLLPPRCKTAGFEGKVGTYRCASVC